MASVQKRTDGVWRARYRDDAGREHARHFARKVYAQRWLDEVTTSRVVGNYVDPRAGRMTFSAWFDEWTGRQVWEPGTVEAANRARACVTFATVPLGKLRRAHVETWVKAMSATLAPSTVLTRFTYVRMALRAAVVEKRIPWDPSDGVRLPRRRKAEASMVIPTTEEVARLLAAAPAHFQAFVAVCAFAGLRLGEAAGLQVGDVDFLRRTVRVERQVQGQTVASTRVCAPKYGSERTVFVPSGLTEVVARHVEEVGTRGGERWLFCSGDALLNRNSAGHIFRQAMSAAGLTGFTLHSLRHFYASALIADGCDVVTVQRALGHSSPSITLDTYSHLWPSAEDKTRQAASRLMDAVLSPAADYVRTEGGEQARDLHVQR